MRITEGVVGVIADLALVRCVGRNAHVQVVPAAGFERAKL
jgi:hypothetical protein